MSNNAPKKDTKQSSIAVYTRVPGSMSETGALTQTVTKLNAAASIPISIALYVEYPNPFMTAKLYFNSEKDIHCYTKAIENKEELHTLIIGVVRVAQMPIRQ